MVPSLTDILLRGEPMSGLSRREELLRAFRQEPVDRIPVSPFIHVNHVKEFFGTHDVDCAVKTPEVYSAYGFDCIHRNCSAAYDPMGPSGADWHVEAARSCNGRDATIRTRVSTPRGRLECREELKWVYEWDAESSLVDYPIKTPEDFELFQAFQPPPGPADVGDIRRAREAVGDDGIVAPWIQGAFNLVALFYRKVDDLLMDALLQPELYRRMMEHFLERYMSFVRQVIDAGADVVSYAGNVANAKMVSRAFFQEHIWPYEKRFIDWIQGQGVPVLYHNCGYAKGLLPLYPRLGLRAYESLTPPPYGDTVLEDAVRTFGTGTTLLGGIDQLDLLRKGSATEIEAAVRRVLDTVRGRCSFILGTTDYFNENTPREKILALAEAGRRYGSL
jgi:uroporphyrinogen decarboxylase